MIGLEAVRGFRLPLVTGGRPWPRRVVWSRRAPIIGPTCDCYLRGG